MYAIEQGRGWVFADAMCRVRWGFDPERAGRSIEDPDVIAEIADSVGLDGKACVKAAQTRAAFDAQLAAWSEESGKDLVFGFPFFTYKDQVCACNITPRTCASVCRRTASTLT